MCKKSQGYEPIPDVENGTLAKANLNNQKGQSPLVALDSTKATEEAKKRYSDLQLSEEQARLLGTLDEAMNYADLSSNLDLTSIPRLVGDTSGIDTVISFAISMIEPTLMVVVTFAMALYLQSQDYLEPADHLVSSLFPYLNATLVFASTAVPLQRRLMTCLIEPIFKTLDQAEGFFKVTLQQLGPSVDRTVDGIQEDFHKVLEPMQPTLDQMEDQAHLLEQAMDKDSGKVDIPDPSDIDRELDQAQGIVTEAMRQAEQHLEYENYVPSYLDSPRQFYWRILAPTLLLAWAFQILVGTQAGSVQKPHAVLGVRGRSLALRGSAYYPGTMGKLRPDALALLLGSENSNYCVHEGASCPNDKCRVEQKASIQAALGPISS